MFFSRKSCSIKQNVFLALRIFFLFLSGSLFSLTASGEEGQPPLPGYRIAEEDSSSLPEKSLPEKQPEFRADSSKEKDEKPAPTVQPKDFYKSRSKEIPGFWEDRRFVEIRGGRSLWIGGPLLRNLEKNIRTFGFDTDYTYNFGSDQEKAFLYNQTQSYSGADVVGVRMGLLYERAVSEHWSVGGGVDYREYTFRNIPNNLLTRLFIMGSQRMGMSETLDPELIQRNINLELLGTGTRARSIKGNKIVFLEINASYHFLPGNVWDPYIRPIFGMGYDTVSRSSAFKLGGGAGIRYYFSTGIYAGGEVSLDSVFLIQERLVRSQGRDRIYEATANLFLGKMFE